MSDDNQSATTTTGTQNTDALPDWARRAISDANAEAAKYRLKAQTAADEAKAETSKAYDEQLKALASEKTAIAAERDNAVTGLTKLKAHATQLKDMFGSPAGRQRATDKSQGAGGNASGVKTPAELFADMVQTNLKK